VQNIAKPATFTDADLPKVVKVLESVVSKTKSFKYSLKGIFELPTSISICAYFPEEVVPSMKLIREEIKKLDFQTTRFMLQTLSFLQMFLVYDSIPASIKNILPNWLS